MRYKCLASPDCMKTFEYGHALRAHIASCESAKKIMKKQDDINRLEYHIGIETPAINGIKMNKYFPSYYALDQTLKYDFKDRFSFGPLEKQLTSMELRLPRRVIKSVSSNVLDSSQIRTIMNHPQ